MVEFGNRVVTAAVSIVVILAVLGSLGRVPRRRDLTWLSLGLVAGVVGQIVLGGITVLVHLHPIAVMSHFLLSMLILGDAVELHHRAGEPDGPRRPRVTTPAVRRAAALLVVLGAAVLVAGTVVTGAGPHGGDERARRFGFTPESVTRVHSLLAWATVATTIVLIVLVRRHRHEAVLAKPLERLLTVLLLQGFLGYLQYALDVPPLLVGTHVVGAVLVWAAVLHVALSLDHVPVPAPPPGEPPAAPRPEPATTPV
jgi:cytochrome c oxidase assembly protein subunit 15